MFNDFNLKDILSLLLVGELCSRQIITLELAFLVQLFDSNFKGSRRTGGLYFMMFNLIKNFKVAVFMFLLKNATFCFCYKKYIKLTEFLSMPM